MNILECVEKIQESIFAYSIKETGMLMEGLVKEIGEILPGLDGERVALLEGILNYITIGMGNQDYLLVADVLKYELTPFLKDKTVIAGGKN